MGRCSSMRGEKRHKRALLGPIGERRDEEDSTPVRLITLMTEHVWNKGDGWLSVCEDRIKGSNVATSGRPSTSQTMNIGQAIPSAYRS